MSTIIFIISACSQNNSSYGEKYDNFILVKGGIFINTNSNYYGKEIEISDFYISKYEITQKDWFDLMGNNPSEFKSKNFQIEAAKNPTKFEGYNLPVESVRWYDCVEYCNKRSEKEGLEPYYKIEKDEEDLKNMNQRDNVKWTVSMNEGANGYRLPTETEWEYAASGGQKSKNYKYSGSNNIDEVAWYWKNSGDEYISGFWNEKIVKGNNCKAKPVGTKKPNELGIYDMSGNVREWCWNWLEDVDTKELTFRLWKGGGWLGGEEVCELSHQGKYEPNFRGSDQGFRICRSV